MAYIADILMINEMTRPLNKGERPSVDPLLNYLKSGAHPSEELRLLLKPGLRAGGLSLRACGVAQPARKQSSFT